MSRKRPEIRIAIDGKYLDEVQIREAEPYAPRAVCYLSFPADRHGAQRKGDRITVSAQAATVVKLFATAFCPRWAGAPWSSRSGARRSGRASLRLSSPAKGTAWTT
jgi:hypothetical protein